MTIQAGSKVKFLNDVGGGILKTFIGEQMALVETDDGFEITMQVSELLPDAGASYDNTGARNASDVKPLIEPEKPVPTYEEKRYTAFNGEAFLAIVPHNLNILHVSNFGLYLLNESNYSLIYTISANDGKINSLVENGIIEPNMKQEVKVFNQTNISRIKDFTLQGVFFKQGLLDNAAPVNITQSIADVSFYKSSFFTVNKYFDQKALILKTASEQEMKAAINKLKAGDFKKITELKEKKETKTEFKSPKSQVIEEVDLHIEEILENTSGMSNAEMLEAQMARFEFTLNSAIQSAIQKIVFIHGVGNGKLRQELRKKLDKSYPKLIYQDASFKEYGYGATMVYLTRI
jgi:hypothetical protein